MPAAIINSSTPTQQVYAELQQAFEHFNLTLFDGTLPQCLLTLQREKKTCGYFSAQRFGNHDGQRVDEIALNPAYFAVSPLQEIMQTIVHEMVHLWQHHHGQPGRGRYHNPQWADKMESIGLMPSSTSRPGGKRTGDHMGDYVIEGGRFERACEQLLSVHFTISWYDRFPPADALQVPMLSSDGSSPMKPGSALAGARPSAGAIPAQALVVRSNLVVKAIDQPATTPSRTKYTCACHNLLWAKAGLRVRCMQCDTEFLDVQLVQHIQTDTHTAEMHHGHTINH